MGKVISITSQKGGVGKTTTSVCLSTLLATQYPNYKFLIIDIDPQRNTTSFFLSSIVPPKETVFKIFSEGHCSSDCFKTTSFSNLYLIPSSLHLVEVEIMLSGNIHGFYLLQSVLIQLKKEFDIILIDCPPSLCMLTLNAMIASDYLIVPLLASKLSLDGLQNLLNSLRSIKERYNPDVILLGGVITMFDNRSIVSQVMLEEIKKYIFVFNNHIPKSIIVEEAYLLKKSVFEISINNKVTIAYKKLLQEILDVIGFK